MKKFIKKNILGIIIGVVIGITSVVIAESINSSEVLYDNSDSVSNDTTVKGALDSLFDIVDHSSTGFSLLARNTSGLSNELLGGLYRYQGTNVNNYICFGTTSKETCVGTPNTYMYRIIGIDVNNQLKLIKNYQLGGHKWNNTSGSTWPNCSLYADLNGSFFLENTAYIPDSSWSNRISSNDWHYANIPYSNSSLSAESMANIELSAPTINAKIGLMYLHDYYYGMPGGNNCSTMSTVCRNSWIHPSINEWLITIGDTSAWSIQDYGGLANQYMINNNVPRPVFYLKSTEKIVSGSGTLSDPYILEDVS